MNLFIDTNIFLSFYHFTNDDLEKLSNLTFLLENEEAILFLPKQVIDEFYRNRENKISVSLKHIKNQELNLQFPQICKDYPEYEFLLQLQESYKKNHTELIKKISNDIKNFNLEADKVIKKLFDSALKIEIKNDIIDKARVRMDIGNPPGKNKSLGDAINWETLLVEVSKDLHFISGDKDYCSLLDNTQFNNFLMREWREKKNSTIYFYKKITDFFKKLFPNIKLDSEFKKDSLIKKLIDTSSFSQTHSIITKLSKFNEFTSDQLNEIVNAAISNRQIYWIIGDEEVHDFYLDIIKRNKNIIDSVIFKKLYELLYPDNIHDENDLPF